MRLADFILGNIEPILVEWEAFHSVWPEAKTDPLALRDHAEDILRATASDMKSAQTSASGQTSRKARGTPAETAFAWTAHPTCMRSAECVRGSSLLALWQSTGRFEQA